VKHPFRQPDTHIAEAWRGQDLSLYLDRCQVDTPPDLVELTWREVRRRRPAIGKVVDFGAGDGRFAQGGPYTEYLGFEIDARRAPRKPLPQGASIVHACAFSQIVSDAQICIGNPPFVRNQDLPEGWRQKVTEQLEARSGVRLSGLANAWQYFFLLSLVSAAKDGLCAIVIPYEWVSRPSAKSVREFIRANRWDVDVYRVADATFGGVLTTSSITVVDKSGTAGRWRFHVDDGEGGFLTLASESGSSAGHLPYRRPETECARAIRGLSPGTQKVFTFTEAERARIGLVPHVDVIRCVTSLRPLDRSTEDLDTEIFESVYRSAGHRCWLLNIVDGEQPPRLRDYLDSVPAEDYATSTCLGRPVWWRFPMPETPQLLTATSFKGPRPKVCHNSAGVKAVGGVAGIHGIDSIQAERFIRHLASSDLADRIVAHAKGLRKIEINQLNSILADLE
jgi:hypothetical protein